ncbi:hypothetical protein [Bradyrhizobium sp. 2TAF24]|uniref:hypothetical protein n=1 Tax=Bradyrhizobium sp. 2TAF24 TaxID=3233011 RepID=UPI003F8FFD86
MPQTSFDPFGEPVPAAIAVDRRPAGAWLARSGNLVFWSLVAVIVAARAAYFHPEVAFRFDAAVAYLHGVVAGVLS